MKCTAVSPEKAPGGAGRAGGALTHEGLIAVDEGTEVAVRWRSCEPPMLVRQ